MRNMRDIFLQNRKNFNKYSQKKIQKESLNLTQSSFRLLADHFDDFDVGERYRKLKKKTQN